MEQLIIWYQDNYMNDCESIYNFNMHKEVIKVLGKNSNKNVFNVFF